MQQLIDLINQYAKLDTEAISSLEKYIEFEAFSKSQFILNSGYVCNKVWFVKSGMVRKFHLNNGNEITSWIHFENEIITSLDSYFNSTPSNEYLQTCEKTQLISITKQNSKYLNQHHQFSTFTNKLFGEQLALINKVSAQFKTMSAVERYNLLQSISPQMIKRAKLGHIASIIGITQETLSRIRKQG